MIQGKVSFLAIDANNNLRVIGLETNGNLKTTPTAIPTNIFNGFLSGKIIAMGLTDSGQVVPIKVDANGAL